jgi:hypothetical protein
MSDYIRALREDIATRDTEIAELKKCLNEAIGYASERDGIIEPLKAEIAELKERLYGVIAYIVEMEERLKL